MKMNKKLITVVAAAALAMSIASTAMAATTGVVEKSVNFRTAPSTSSSVLGLVKTGTAFTVLEQVNSYWVKASVNGQTGYLSTDYIKLNSGGSQAEPANGTGVVEKSANFRTGPSTSSSVIGLVKTGTAFTLLEQVNSYWVKVNVNGQVGYLSTDYVKINAGGSSSPQPAPTPTPTDNAAETKADRILIHANNLRGITKYAFGVNQPQTLMDCSAFTKYVYGLEGVSLKWGTRYQKDSGTAVSKADLKKGDLLFFWLNDRNTIGHVGIYMGNGQMIHNAPSFNGVGISSITSGYWSDHYVSARRVL